MADIPPVVTTLILAATFAVLAWDLDTLTWLATTLNKYLEVKA